MKNIVIGIDFSQNAVVAMRHAIAIAIRRSGIIHLVWVRTPGSSQNIVKANSKDYAKSAQEKLQEMEKNCKSEAPNCEVRSVILEGKAPTQLTSYAANLEDALLVIGTHGISGFEEFFVGSNAYRAICLSRTPVLILREGINIKRDLTNIVVPIDASFETLQKMKQAIAYTHVFNAKLLLLGIMTSNKEDCHTVEVQLKHAVSKCDEANIRYEVNTLKQKGNKAKELVAFATKKDANLLIIMREEEQNFSDIWVGSSARQLINAAPMPLLIIPNDNHFSVTK